MSLSHVFPTFFLGKSAFRAARPGGGESAGRVRDRRGAGSSETLPQLPLGDGFLQKSDLDLGHLRRRLESKLVK